MQPEEDHSRTIQTGCIPACRVSVETLLLHIPVLVWGEDKTKTHCTKIVIVEIGWREGGRGEQPGKYCQKQHLQKIQMYGLVHKACGKKNYTPWIADKWLKCIMRHSCLRIIHILILHCVETCICVAWCLQNIYARAFVLSCSFHQCGYRLSAKRKQKAILALKVMNEDYTA